MGKHLRRLGNTVSVPLRTDESGYLGRECPKCEKYFKITPGTGLTGKDLDCVCAYCGHRDSHRTFFTREQIEHAKSVVLNKLTGAFLSDLKEMECDVRPRGGFGLGLSIKVTGSPHPVRYYREKALETELVCESCTLRYAIYGLFAFCPDCGTHNSRQILENNLALAEKQLELADSIDASLREQLRGDALENVVSSFDGFGRKACQVSAHRSTNANRAHAASFQNLKRAKDDMQQLFGVDLSTSVSCDEWNAAFRAFQKRHLLAHTMGVVDTAYVASTGDHSIPVGRKVVISKQEVVGIVAIVRRLAATIERALLPRSDTTSETT